MSIISKILDVFKPESEEYAVACPETGKDHRWLDASTHDHPQRKICLDCHEKEGYGDD